MPGVYQGVRMRGCLERTRALVPGKTQGVRESERVPGKIQGVRESERVPGETQGVRGSQRECLGRPRALGDHRESTWGDPGR